MVCGKSNGKWFGRKYCALEPNHPGWCDWDVIGRIETWEGNRYTTGTSKHNHIVAAFIAAGFAFNKWRYDGTCNRCREYMTSFTLWEADIAPSGYQGRHCKEAASVCLVCEEVAGRGSIAAYLVPFLVAKQVNR